MEIRSRTKIFETIAIIAPLAYYAFFLLFKINLTTADLGRHITNGKLVFAGQGAVLKTNLLFYRPC